ncbi:MAG: hypothetical protein IJ866_02030 [Alphaproteobacteria bacterium]|nr:hypothetical protein [Alphaproteobacteria bacterium]
MKKVSLLILAALMPFAATAAENRDLILDIRRIGLDLSKTDVRHAADYSDSPIQALKADDQEFIKGVFDTVLEYKVDDLKWDNSLFMEYGKTKLEKYTGETVTNENADKILLTSDLSWARWHMGDLKFGPMARAAYETEFAASGDAPRQNVFRASAGLSLFDHPIIKSLYLVGVYEYDFTYSEHKVNKSAVEAGWRLEYEIREGVKLSTNGYYREYLSYSEYVPTDLERDFSATARMDTNLWGNFTMGPYVQYRRAKARGVDTYGSNFMIGLSFNYIMKYDIFNKTEK